MRRWPLNIFSRYHGPSTLQITRNCPRGERTGAPVQTGPRVRPTAAQIQAPNRRGVPRPFQQRPRDEQLIERQLAVKNVAAGQSVGPLEIERRDHLAGEDRGSEAWRVALDRARGGVAKTIALRVPIALEVIRRVLDVRRDDVLTLGGERRIGNRRDGRLDPRLVGEAAVL